MGRLPFDVPRRGGYPVAEVMRDQPRQGGVRTARYKRHQGEISLVMSHFLIEYLRELHLHFDGDLTSVILLGEIAHHNMASHFHPTGMKPGTSSLFHGSDPFRERLASCNAYSLAAALNLPYESVRRKLSGLQRKGWLARGKDGGLRITPKLAQHFLPDFTFRLMGNMLQAAERINKLLEV